MRPEISDFDHHSNTQYRILDRVNLIYTFKYWIYIKTVSLNIYRSEYVLGHGDIHVCVTWGKHWKEIKIGHDLQRTYS